MHCSRPYHPQSQGKIERLYREQREKIHYDMIKLRKKGVNWIQNLPGNMRVLNELARGVLSWKSPFEVYYGRIPNNIQNAGRFIPKEVIVDERIIELPSARNLQERKKNKKLRERVNKSGKRMDERVVKKHNTLYKNVAYRINDSLS